jgi:cell division protease FtsH
MSTNGSRRSRPESDLAPLPVPGEYISRPREEDLPTRKKLGLWDRIKFLVLIGFLFGLIVLTIYYQYEPLMTAGDAFSRAVGSYWWLLAIGGIEVLRQIHYLICEHVSPYYHLWKRFFARIDNHVQGVNDWTRFRIARTFKWTLIVVVLSIILGMIFHKPPLLALLYAPVKLVSALPLVFQFALLFFVIIIQFVGMAWYAARQGIDVYFPDDIKTRFTDVWGQDQVLRKVQENVLFLENPKSIEDRGGYVPNGILLWGPPGTGKTLMAEAVAGETGRPFVFVDPGGLTAFGFGALAVKGVFRKLRKLAVQYGGVIVFFDEADSLGNRGQLMPGGTVPQPSAAWSTAPGCNGLSFIDPQSASLIARSSLQSTVEDRPRRLRDGFFFMGGGQGGGGMLQALLTELSGLKKPRGFFNRVVRRALGMRPKPPPKYRILAILATNMPQALDEALLRPGRIDRIYKVGYPSKAGRILTYNGYFDKVRHELTAEDIDQLATITPYATGATIKDLVNESLITAIRDGREVITWRDVIKAKQLKSLGPPEDVEYIERERHAVAVHEACHAVAAFRVRRHMSIDIATIEKGGTYLGMVANIPLEDQFTHWRTEFESDIIVSLASLAGERLFFEDDSSSGVSGDLETATLLATYMEGYWGMGSTVASHGVTHKVGIGGGGKPGSGKDKKEREQSLLEGGLGTRIEVRLDELLLRAKQLLQDNRLEILAVAHALETNKTVTGEDIEAIIEGRRGALLDGRPYHDPRFLEEAEAYHLEAVKAHRQHAGVAAPMPQLHPATPEAAAFSPDPNGAVRPQVVGPVALQTGGGDESPNGDAHDSESRPTAPADEDET